MVAVAGVVGVVGVGAGATGTINVPVANTVVPLPVLVRVTTYEPGAKTEPTATDHVPFAEIGEVAVVYTGVTVPLPYKVGLAAVPME